MQNNVVFTSISVCVCKIGTVFQLGGRMRSKSKSKSIVYLECFAYLWIAIVFVCFLSWHYEILLWKSLFSMILLYIKDTKWLGVGSFYDDMISGKFFINSGNWFIIVLFWVLSLLKMFTKVIISKVNFYYEGVFKKRFTRICIVIFNS